MKEPCSERRGKHGKEGQNVEVVKLEISKVIPCFLIKVTMLWILGVEAKEDSKVCRQQVLGQALCLPPRRQKF